MPAPKSSARERQKSGGGRRLLLFKGDANYDIATKVRNIADTLPYRPVRHAIIAAKHSGRKTSYRMWKET